MKKILFLLLLCMPGLVQAQTMREVFTAMPDSLQQLLSKNNRMDMMDFLDSKMEARVTNRLDGQSTMETLTEDYLKITLAEQVTLQMKLYSKGEQKILAVVHTAGGPVLDSYMSFYTPAWEPLPVQVKVPEFSAFEVKDRSELTVEQVQLLESLADMQLTEITLSPENAKAVFTLSLNILPKEDRDKVRELVKPVEVEL